MPVRTSRMLAVALATPVATVVLTAGAAAPARAEGAKNLCAYDPVIDGSTRIRACIQAVEGEEPTVKPWARMRFASPDPSKWDSCTVVVALFIDGQKRTDKVTSCLAWALTGSSTYPEVTTFSGWTTKATSGPDYKGVARWYGTYNGQPVGSHVNSHSPEVDFVTIGFSDKVEDDQLPVDGVVNNPPVPEAVEEYYYEPAVPVEFDTP